MEETVADRSLLIKFLSRPRRIHVAVKRSFLRGRAASKHHEGNPVAIYTAASGGWRNVTDATAALGVETSIRQLVRNSLELRVRMTDRATTGPEAVSPRNSPPTHLLRIMVISRLSNRQRVFRSICAEGKLGLTRDSLCRICRGCRETARETMGKREGSTYITYLLN